MIFISSVKSINKNIAAAQGRCQKCGNYTTYEFFKSYRELSLFFIPVFRWNNKYYLRVHCCNIIYEITNDFGKSIEKGEINNLSSINFSNTEQQKSVKICDNCGYILNDNFCYCPKCGERIK